LILIVEDHCDSGEILRRLLARFGYEARCVETADEALKALREQPIRVAVLDYNLPDHDGLWLLDQIRADPTLRFVRVIILSATFEHDLGRRALERGAMEWLVKGVHGTSHIVAAVQRAFALPPAV